MSTNESGDHEIHKGSTSPVQVQDKEVEDILDSVMETKENKPKETASEKSSEESLVNDSDEELDKLLDSALEDFSKPPPTSQSEAAVKDLKEAASKLREEGAPADAAWTEEFIKQATSQFEQNMRSLLTQGAGSAEAPKPEELGASFQKIAEAAAKAVVEDSGDGDFSDAISQTLKSLSEGAEGLQNPPSEEEFMNMFGGMALGGDGASDGDFLPFMQQMMQSLLSKEVLYPALKEIVDKYPAWLDENKSTLEESKFEQYSHQYKLMKQVCEELERESDSDTEDVRKQRFNQLLDLMQKMQDCGHPPQDLVGDLGATVPFDEQGNPRIPGLPLDQNQCVVM